MPRKSIDIRLTDYPVKQKRGQPRPFPAFWRGRVRAEPEYGSRDWSLVGIGATPQGLKLPISAIFKVRVSLFFSALFFIDYLTLPFRFYLRSAVIFMLNNVFHAPHVILMSKTAWAHLYHAAQTVGLLFYNTLPVGSPTQAHARFPSVAYLPI